jgi:uncharacterized protein YjbJ (UPF0337 family)
VEPRRVQNSKQGTVACLVNIPTRVVLTFVVLLSRQQATGNRQQATGNRQQATGNRQQATGNRQQATVETHRNNASLKMESEVCRSDVKKAPLED